MCKMSLIVERLRVAKISGFTSPPFSKNHLIDLAAVGKSGSQSALASSQVPCWKASWMG